jgi:hypothetical protein
MAYMAEQVTTAAVALKLQLCTTLLCTPDPAGSAAYLRSSAAFSGNSCHQSHWVAIKHNCTTEFGWQTLLWQREYELETSKPVQLHGLKHKLMAHSLPQEWSLCGRTRVTL